MTAEPLAPLALALANADPRNLRDSLRSTRSAAAIARAGAVAVYKLAIDLAKLAERQDLSPDELRAELAELIEHTLISADFVSESARHTAEIALAFDLAAAVAQALA